jgi:hypothetical protein
VKIFIQTPYFWFDVIFFQITKETLGFQIGIIFSGVNLLKNILLMHQQILVCIAFYRRILNSEYVLYDVNNTMFVGSNM